MVHAESSDAIDDLRAGERSRFGPCFVTVGIADFRFYRHFCSELSELLAERYKIHLEEVRGVNWKRFERFNAESYYAVSGSHNVAGTTFDTECAATVT